MEENQAEKYEIEQHRELSSFNEETAAEIAPRIDVGDRDRIDEMERKNEAEGTDNKSRAIGWVAIVLSVLSIIGVMPIIMGAAGIIVGFIARRKGLTGLGSWAIGLGAVSIIVSLFIAPFLF